MLTPLRLSRHAFVAPLILSLGLVACGQPPPPGSTSEASTEGAEDPETDTGDETSGTTETGTETETDTETGTETDTETDTDPETGMETDTEDPSDAGADSLYPLIDGATWTYISKTTQGQVLGMEEVEVTAIEFDGQPAWLQVDSPNASGNWTKSTLSQVGDDTLRVYKEEHGPMGITAYVYYDPGFLRAADNWSMGAVDDFEERLYDRTEYDNPELLNPSLEPRGHAYKIVSINESVTVPAGTFNCVGIERIRTVGVNIGDRVLFWYALGIGKVREERPAESKIEELAEVHIPGGAQFPG